MRVLLISTLILLPVAGFPGEGDRKLARERYEAAVQQALGTRRLDVEADIEAITARARADSSEVNRLEKERDTIDETPAEKLMKKIEDTRWEFGDGGYVQFLKDGKGHNHKHDNIVWLASNEKSVLQQNLRTADLFVWEFSADAESVTRYAFKLREESARHPANHPVSPRVRRPPQLRNWSSIGRLSNAAKGNSASRSEMESAPPS